MDKIKITMERSSSKGDLMIAVANCDSEIFLEGVCADADCPHDKERTICCVLCDLLFDCTKPCWKISKIEMKARQKYHKGGIIGETGGN